ncbi:hypothetical protein HAX54_016718 [Datura stramonium]|uniref:Amidase domain-containing protein n=1 Tax=Datura stramonium TaxID=4076 RepID=A0ABS8UJD8_DATST|nr:hypothetical protein [Datura stramonium]
MGNKRVMIPASEIDLTAVKYIPENIQAPHLTGFWFKFFVKLIEAPGIGSLIMNRLKNENKIDEKLKYTVIPEGPMFKPEFPPQEPEPAVVSLEEDVKPEDRVELALKCLPDYDPASNWSDDSTASFRYWKIRDYAYAYRSKFRTPSMVAARFISAIEEFNNKNPAAPLLISFDPDEVRKQAAASTQRFEQDRYTGGSSSGPAAIVASGLCSAALGTDGGGSVRIPSSLCGVVGLKSTYGRTDMNGSLCDDGTVEIIGPIATTVEDTILVYAAILGSSPVDRISLSPSFPCVPNFPSQESSQCLESLCLGKYTEWFNDVFSTDISDKCENVLSRLSEKHGCKTVEIVIPELHEMRIAHIVSIGSESLCALNSDCNDGKEGRLTYDTRTNLAFFRTFTAADYVAAQRLRRRLMYFHLEIFKKVDIIVTPTTGMTAPRIPPSALKVGETDLQVSGNLMRFIITANLLGLPAVTVPVGYDKQGLPIGMQLIGRPWCEASILRLAAAIEETCAEPKKKPLQYYDILKGN